MPKNLNRKSAGGLLQAGQKLPSVRTLSRNRKVSVSTVLQAYLTLETKGFVEARPQSGYYVLTPLATAATGLKMPSLGIKHSDIRTADVLASMRRTSREDSFFQLGCAHLGLDLYPQKKLAALAGKVIRHSPEYLSQMDFPPGNPRLRHQIAARYREIGVSVTADDIVLTSGCGEALYLAFRSCTQPGDTVLVESPTYFGTLEVLQQLGLKALEVPTDPKTGLDLQATREAFERFPIKAGFVVPNFGNPTGALMPEENKKELVKIFAQNKAKLIEDDIFGELSFEQDRPKPLKAYDTRQCVMTCSSFSKTIGPGLRVGWIMAGDLQEAIESAKYLLNGCVPLITTETVAEFLESGSYERYLRRVRHLLSTQMARTSEAVLRSFPAGTEISQPRGGFVLWVKLPKGASGLQLYRKAVDAKINITPGTIFSASGRFENYIRISCGSWSEGTAKAIQKLGSLL